MAVAKRVGLLALLLAVPLTGCQLGGEPSVGPTALTATTVPQVVNAAMKAEGCIPGPPSAPAPDTSGYTGLSMSPEQPLFDRPSNLASRRINDIEVTLTANCADRVLPVLPLITGTILGTGGLQQFPPGIPGVDPIVRSVAIKLANAEVDARCLYGQQQCKDVGLRQAEVAALNAVQRQEESTLIGIVNTVAFPFENQSQAIRKAGADYLTRTHWIDQPS